MTPIAFVTSASSFSAKSSFHLPLVCNRASHSMTKWTMGKQSKFGIFTPAVLTTKLVIGDKNLNKIRGKAIALHSQAITAFCRFTGAGPKMRTNLIRTAKENGNTLGFLS